MEGFILGFSMGWYCLLSCGMYLAPFLFAEDSDNRGTTMYVLIFLAGRLISYAAVGMIAGSLGSILSTEYARFSKSLAAVSGVAVGIILLSGGLLRAFPSFRPCQFLNRAYKPAVVALLFGLLTGLSLCPPFIAAIASVLSRGTVLAGVLYFFWFYLGTCVFFIPFSVIKVPWLNVDAVRNVARIMMMIMGAYFLVKGFCAFLAPCI